MKNKKARKDVVGDGGNDGCGRANNTESKEKALVNVI
jgi:hypothetical protein